MSTNDDREGNTSDSSAHSPRIASSLSSDNLRLELATATNDRLSDQEEIVRMMRLQMNDQKEAVRDSINCLLFIFYFF